MRIDGITYEFTLASDLERDGMSLECERIDAQGARTLVLEAFWRDPTGLFTGVRGSTFMIIGARFGIRLRNELFASLLKQDMVPCFVCLFLFSSISPYLPRLSLP